MLNLTRPVAFSKEENDHINGVLRIKDAKGNLLNWIKGRFFDPF